VAPVSDRARMEHGAAVALLEMAFCLVELRGLEPLTPCLQNTPGLSVTVAHLALRRLGGCWDRPKSGPVVVRLGGQGRAVARLTAQARAVSTGHVLLAMLREQECVAAKALASLGITAEAARQQLDAMSIPAEDGPSSYGISRRITCTRMTMGTLSNARFQWHKTGHADEDQPRTAEGYPYMCTGEILLAMINVYKGAVIGADAAAAAQVLARLGVDLSGAYEHVLDIVRRSPADEATGGAKPETRSEEAGLPDASMFVKGL
jgi:Clp amino terminal domain, pathogenicity island component